MATICRTVLTLPTMTTATNPRRFISAIHSRKALMNTSRLMMTMPAKVIHRLPCSPISTVNAVTTISLSATGSRNAPKRVVCPSLRAK